MDKRLLTATSLFIGLLLANNFAFADSFFGDTLSPREQQKMQSSLQQMEGVSDKLDDLGTLLIFESLSKGDCKSFVDIEGPAKQGDAKKQWLLSDLYHQGLCVKKDDKKALELLHSAAGSGHDAAYFDLGAYYYYGWGTEKNTTKAFHWFSKAAEVKRSDSYRFLGIMSASGEGTTQNYQNAYKWLLLGAKAGDYICQSMVASFMSAQDSEFYNPYEGYKWALLAQQAGDANFQETNSKTIEALTNVLSNEQIQSAQAAVEGWKPETQDTNAPQAIKLPNIADDYADKLTADEALKKLIELGIKKDRDLYFQAVSEDNLGVFKLFVKAGAPLDARVQGMYAPPLYAAANSGSKKVFNFLLENGANIDTPINHANDTALLKALSAGHKDMAVALLDKGADVSHPGLVYNAVQYNDPALLDRLIKAGAVWDNEFIPGKTPLGEAISGTIGDNFSDQQCFPASAKFLIEKGARANVVSSTGGSLVRQAMNAKNPEICLKLLLEHGAKLSKEGNQSDLFYASLTGNSAVIKLLLEYGSNPNETYNLKSDQIPYVVEDKPLKDALTNGATPLMIAVSLGHAAAVKEMINHGANPNKKTANGVTALTLAENKDNRAILDILKQAPKSPASKIADFWNSLFGGN